MSWQKWPGTPPHSLGSLVAPTCAHLVRVRVRVGLRVGVGMRVRVRVGVRVEG